MSEVFRVGRDDDGAFVQISGSHLQRLSDEEVISIIRALTAKDFSFSIEEEQESEPVSSVAPKPSELLPSRQVIYAEPVPPGLNITPNARKFALQLGVPLMGLLDLVNGVGVEARWPGDEPQIEYIVGSDYGLVIAHDQELVLSVKSRDQLWVPKQSLNSDQRMKPKASRVKYRKASGGSGRQYPTTVSDLIKTLRSRGFTVIRQGSGGHYNVTMPDSTRRATVPCSPSDSHSLMNCVKDIERIFQVDLRQK